MDLCQVGVFISFILYIKKIYKIFYLILYSPRWLEDRCSLRRHLLRRWLRGRLEGKGWRRRLEEEAGGGVWRRRLEATRAAGEELMARQLQTNCFPNSRWPVFQPIIPKDPRPSARARGQVRWLVVTALQVMK